MSELCSCAESQAAPCAAASMEGGDVWRREMPTGYWDRQGHRWNDVKYFFLVLIASRKRVAEPIWGGKER